MNPKEQIKKDRGVNWVKCTLGLNKTCWALHVYVEEKLTNYKHKKCNLRSSQTYFTDDELSHIDNGAGCIRTKFKDAVKYKRDKISKIFKWEWIDNTCQKCKGAFQKILALHTEVIKNENEGESHFKDIHWASNCSNTSSISLEWAMAKMFMRKGNENNKGPKDTDPAALLSLMINCDLFTNPIRRPNKINLKKARNSLYHSPDNEVSEIDKKKYFDSMKDLLLDASNDMEVEQNTRDCIKKDIDEIEKLRKSEISMTLFDDALRIKRKGIYDDFEKCLCENDVDQLRQLLKLAEKVAEDLQFINDNFEEMKKIEIYKTEIDRLNGMHKTVHEKTKSIKESHKNIKHEVRNELEGFKHFQTEILTKSKQHISEMDRRLCENFESVKEKTKRIREEQENMKQEISSELKGFKKFQIDIQWKANQQILDMESQLANNIDSIKEKTKRIKESRDAIKQEVRNEFEDLRYFQTELQSKTKQYISEMEKQQSYSLALASRQIINFIKDYEKEIAMANEKANEKLRDLSERLQRIDSRQIDKHVKKLKDALVLEKENRRTQNELINRIRVSLGHITNDIDALQQSPNSASLLFQGWQRLQLGVSIFCQAMIDGVHRLNTDGFVIIVVGTVFIALMMRLWVLHNHEEVE